MCFYHPPPGIGVRADGAQSGPSGDRMLNELMSCGSVQQASSSGRVLKDRLENGPHVAVVSPFEARTRECSRAGVRFEAGPTRGETTTTYCGTKSVEVVAMSTHAVQIFKGGGLIQTKIHTIIFMECCMCTMHILANLT